MPYGFVGSGNRWREFATKQQCLASARRQLAKEDDIGIYHYPKGVEMYDREYDVFTEESEKCYDGHVWISSIYAPQYTPKGSENKFSYNLKADGTLAGVGWVHPQYAKMSAQKSRNNPMVYATHIGKNWREFATIKDVFKAFYGYASKQKTETSDLLFKYPKGTIIQDNFQMQGDWEKYVLGQLFGKRGRVSYVDDKKKDLYVINPDGSSVRDEW